MEELKQLIENLKNCNDIISLNDLRNDFCQSDVPKTQTLPPYLWDALNYIFNKRAFELFTGVKEVTGEVLEVTSPQNKDFIVFKRLNDTDLILRKNDIHFAFSNDSKMQLRTAHGEFYVKGSLEEILSVLNS